MIKVYTRLYDTLCPAFSEERFLFSSSTAEFMVGIVLRSKLEPNLEGEGCNCRLGTGVLTKTSFGMSDNNGFRCVSSGSLYILITLNGNSDARQES